MLDRFRTTYHEFPSRFWVLVSASFVDGVGRTIINPFFALYVTQRFHVGMTQAGLLLALFSISGFAGNLLGGALADRFGRKGIILFGLVFSALSSVSMGLVDSLEVFYVLAVFVGFLSDIAGPAHGAMVADMLPGRQRAEGFGILRISGNLAWIVGPTIGGFLAARSYLLLFILDAISSLITAIIVLRLIPETRPPVRDASHRESLPETFRGYQRVLRDGSYLAFLGVSALLNLVYLQMYSTFSVYLRDVQSIPTQGYGLLMSTNALLVVLLQLWVTRRVKPYPPMVMMALGSTLYMIGFTLFGVVSAYPWFVVSMLVITCGEMIVIPVSQALVARFAPEEARGRYMAVFGLCWGIPAALGPWGAGMIMDHYDPRWVWYLAGILCAAAVLGYMTLQRAAQARIRPERVAASSP